MSRNWKALLAVTLPLAIMVGWLGQLFYDRETGLVVELPITAYDPRDLLAGRYLQFQVVYGDKGDCPKYEMTSKWVCQCVEPNKVTWSGSCDEKPAGCEYFIRGHCRYGRFSAGIDRIYIAENSPQRNFPPNESARVRLRVPHSGRALVVEIIP